MILLIIVLSSPLCIGELYGDYCGNSCITPFGIHRHTVCERAMRRCTWGARCGIIQKNYLSDEVRQAILNEHNELRNKIALGKETRGPQPSASNMNILNYNFELEFIAQCHANTCNFEHDKCRKGLNLSVGQNLGIHSRTAEFRMQDIINMSLIQIHDWYDEVKDFKTNEIDRFIGGSQGTGHYTQIVWSDIEYIGCGLTIWLDYDWYHLLLVCNYGGKETGGNLRAAPIYKKGAVCSKCPAGKSCNEKYKGLCGKVIPVSEVDKGIYGRSSTLKFVTIFGTRAGKQRLEIINYINTFLSYYLIPDLLPTADVHVMRAVITCIIIIKDIKLQDLSVCLVITIWCLFTKMLL